MSEVACSSSSNQLETIFAKQFQDHNIEIFGTKDEPLFKAKQIGEMLGIAKIRDTIQNMDDLCKVKRGAGTTGGLQEQWFLTEDGLIELLCISKKSIAKEFRIWIRTVVKEIRKNGEYKLKRQLEEHQKLLESKDQKELELTNRLHQLEIESQAEREEKERLSSELEEFKSKKYEEIKKTGCNYTLKTDALNFYKNGMSRNVDAKPRVNSLQTSNEQDIEILHEFKTSCPKLLESCIHYALERYRSNGGREFFSCKLEHIINIVDMIGHVIDTGRSSYENITRAELLEKLFEKLGTEINIPNTVTEVEQPEALREDEGSNLEVRTALENNENNEMEAWWHDNIDVDLEFGKQRKIHSHWLTKDEVKRSLSLKTNRDVEQVIIPLIRKFAPKVYPDYRQHSFYTPSGEKKHGFRCWLG